MIYIKAHHTNTTGDESVVPEGIDFTYFICQEITVFLQQGWNLWNVGRFAVRCTSINEDLKMCVYVDERIP